MSAELNAVLDSLFSYVRSVETERTSEAKSSGKGGHGWLFAIAKALGKIADNLGKLIEKKAAALDDSIRAGKKDLTEQNAELQALAQQMNMLMQAISNVIKTIGEGSAAIARKQ